MKITVETLVKAEPDKVWEAWNDPEAIKQRNAPRTTGTSDLDVALKPSAR